AWRGSRLLLRPQPSPSLSPYTTLFRSLHARPEIGEGGLEHDVVGDDQSEEDEHRADDVREDLREHDPDRPGAAGDGRLDELLLRSEEHTSELQSLAYLVCRLLLEKKDD